MTIVKNVSKQTYSVLAPPISLLSIVYSKWTGHL